jgi:hypothetical protein
MLYEDSSGCSSLRCEEDLISVHQNQIDDVVDFETFNKLKEFSSKIQSLEEEINSKLIELKITSLREAVLPPSPLATTARAVPPSPLATTARAVPQLPSATSPPRHH